MQTFRGALPKTKGVIEAVETVVLAVVLAAVVLAEVLDYHA